MHLGQNGSGRDPGPFCFFGLVFLTTALLAHRPSLTALCGRFAFEVSLEVISSRVKPARLARNGIERDLRPALLTRSLEGPFVLETQRSPKGYALNSRRSRLFSLAAHRLPLSDARTIGVFES